MRKLGFVGAMVNGTLGTSGWVPRRPRAGAAASPVRDAAGAALPAPVGATGRTGKQAVPRILAAGHLAAGHLGVGLARRDRPAGAADGRRRVFDRHPDLRLVVGHAGGMLPFMFDRVDRQLTSEASALASHRRSTYCTRCGSSPRTVLAAAAAVRAAGLATVAAWVAFPDAETPAAVGVATRERLSRQRDRIRARLADHRFLKAASAAVLGSRS